MKTSSHQNHLTQQRGFIRTKASLLAARLFCGFGRHCAFENSGRTQPSGPRRRHNTGRACAPGASACLRLRTACAARLLPLLLVLVLPAAAHAQYSYTTNNGSITITGFTRPGGAMTIPSTIDGLPVTRIKDSAFLSFSSMTSVTIPSSFTAIKGGAFSRFTRGGGRKLFKFNT